MMTLEQIAAMRVDADAGTPGPWRAVEASHGPVDIFDQSGRDVVTVYGCGVTESRKANARNIARVPDMIATIIAQAAEIERLKSGIPWRDGPPPEEWRDGRDVLVSAKSCTRPVFVHWWAGTAWMDDEADSYSEGEITHHAAITKPGAPHADT